MIGMGEPPTERMYQIGEMAYRAYRQRHQELDVELPVAWEQLTDAKKDAWAWAGLVAFNMGVNALTKMQTQA